MVFFPVHLVLPPSALSHVSLVVFIFLNFTYFFLAPWLGFSRAFLVESFPLCAVGVTGMTGMPWGDLDEWAPLSSPPDVSSDSPDTGNSDSIGHGPRQGPHEQDRGHAGCRRGCGAGPVRLLQEGEHPGAGPEAPLNELSELMPHSCARLTPVSGLLAESSVFPLAFP